ncbi:protein kinase family protein [Flavobacterium sp. 102]|uniref:protein kinase domain-containing protein n=1 Tax=Flavobacterium sp. 102 TaxID=2135623 RepID=UPI000EADED98|nr:protein kinase family protein [Flavobacterium sp. 102]RKS00572.1 protein kinase-like protein [Flavobacterium sp. 102]
MFPTLSEYNKTIQAQGVNAFRTLNNIFFIPARTSPIKIYSFGSGSFAVVFKALENDKEIAIRCFIGTDIDYVERYRKIDNYLKTIKENWKTNIQFLDNEIEINGKLFPVVKMDWVEGKLLDRFLNINLQNNEVLSELQKQIFKTSRNLEKNRIAHGDIQCGNIIIKEVNGKPKIKLIDYDGMYIPDFIGEKQIERGRSEFQHPNRNSFAFNEKIDRFSFWVILCALEALKFDKTLWKEIMQGGFNTLDNLLFVASDFNDPNQSKLFNRLENLNQPSLNFYLEQIKNSLITSTVGLVKLFGQIENVDEELQIIENEQQFDKSTPLNIRSSNQVEHINITSIPNSASVRNKNYINIGKTPIKIDRSRYLNEEIKIIFGTKSKSIIIDEFSNDINVDFDKIILSKPIIKKTEPIITPIIEENQSNSNNPIIWIGLILIVMIICGAIYENDKNNYNNDYSSEAVADSTAAIIDTSAAFIDSDSIPTLIQEEAVDSAAAPITNHIDVATNLYRNYFVGRWSDENSTFVFYDDGDYFIKWDNGNSKWTKWEYYDGKLYFGTGYNNSMIRQYVLSFESNSFRYIEDGTETVYSAYRIGN